MLYAIYEIDSNKNERTKFVGCFAAAELSRFGLGVEDNLPAVGQAGYTPCGHMILGVEQAVSLEKIFTLPNPDDVASAMLAGHCGSGLLTAEQRALATDQELYLLDRGVLDVWDVLNAINERAAAHADPALQSA